MMLRNKVSGGDGSSTRGTVYPGDYGCNGRGNYMRCVQNHAGTNKWEYVRGEFNTVSMTQKTYLCPG